MGLVNKDSSPAVPANSYLQRAKAVGQVPLLILAVPFHLVGGILGALGKLLISPLTFATSNEDAWSSRTLTILTDVANSFLPAKRTAEAALACIGIHATHQQLLTEEGFVQTMLGQEPPEKVAPPHTPSFNYNNRSNQKTTDFIKKKFGSDVKAAYEIFAGQDDEKLYNKLSAKYPDSFPSLDPQMGNSASVPIDIFERANPSSGEDSSNSLLGSADILAAANRAASNSMEESEFDFGDPIADYSTQKLDYFTARLDNLRVEDLVKKAYQVASQQEGRSTLSDRDTSYDVNYASNPSLVAHTTFDENSTTYRDSTVSRGPSDIDEKFRPTPLSDHDRETQEHFIEALAILLAPQNS